jgi:uncharacterized protein (DUF2141 family)
MSRRLPGSLALCLFSASAAASAAELLVTVSGLKGPEGEIGCALYRSAEGFPMDSSKATTFWQKARPGSVECRFGDLSPGRYAVAVSVDLNGNRKTDTNFVGIPKEDWGVSNNVRPKMRAPKFEEAAFEVTGETTRIEIKAGR